MDEATPTSKDLLSQTTQPKAEEAPVDTRVKAAGIDEMVQSNLFDEIRAIPTGGYFQPSLKARPERFQKESLAHVKTAFKGIFDQENHPSTLKSRSLLPGQRFKNVSNMILSPTEKLGKDVPSGLTGARTVKNRDGPMNDHLMKLYHSAHRKIKNNIKETSVSSQLFLEAQQRRLQEGPQTMTHAQNKSHGHDFRLGQESPKMLGSKGFQFGATTNLNFQSLPHRTGFNSQAPLDEIATNTSSKFAPQLKKAQLKNELSN